MADVLTVQDLELAKKHDTFHSEVITGRVGGSASGSEIDTATNAVTGQVQTTLPKVLRDVGFKPASFNFVTGGTLGVTDADKCIYNPAPAGDDNWYSWGGALPHAVAPGTDPTAVGSGYVPRTDVVLRAEIKPSVTEALRRSYAEAGFTLVDGSFEEGGTLTSASDVLLHKASGKAYSWTGSFPKVVNAGSTPTPLGSGGWIDRSDVTLRSELSAYDGQKLIGMCPDIATLRTIEPDYDGQLITLKQHTSGAYLGGGQFRSLVDGSSYTDNNVTIIKTSGGAVWLRINAETNDVKFNHSNPLGNKLQIIAHRGLAFQYPENTLVACSSAISLGVDGLELDAAVSADGVAYLFHDETVDALTDGTGTFTELGSVYIDGLSFTSTAGTILSSEKIPRLIDVLLLCRKYGVHVTLELKLIKDTNDIDYIISLINQYNMQHLVSLQSGNLTNVQYVRSVDSVINVGYVTNDPSYQTYIDILYGLGNATVSGQHDMIFANQGLVKYARDRGVDVQAWTVEDNIYAERIQKVGVYKIITSRLTGELQR